MKKFCYLITLLFFISCGSMVKNMELEEDNIEKVEVFQGFPGEKIEMEEGYEKKLIRDLNHSTDNGPTKFSKTHRILIYHSDGKIDTVRTNGTIHRYNGWYKSEENLIEKYIR